MFVIFGVYTVVTCVFRCAPLCQHALLSLSLPHLLSHQGFYLSLLVEHFTTFSVILGHTVKQTNATVIITSLVAVIRETSPSEDLLHDDHKGYKTGRTRLTTMESLIHSDNSQEIGLFLNVG